MAQKDKQTKETNPFIQFLRKDGKPVMIPLHTVLNEQSMKERKYALGYAETFADIKALDKVKGLKHEGKAVSTYLKEKFNA